MTRKNAIITGMVGLSALAMGAPAARAEDSKEANPEVEKIRALLQAHDDSMTNHDLKGVMACLTAKAALMGTGPGEIWVGPDEIKVAYEHFFDRWRHLVEANRDTLAVLPHHPTVGAAMLQDHWTLLVTATTGEPTRDVSSVFSIFASCSSVTEILYANMFRSIRAPKGAGC
jgi:hypothetical protein